MTFVTCGLPLGAYNECRFKGNWAAAWTLTPGNYAGNWSVIEMLVKRVELEAQNPV
jgi:hypothetical protein